MRDDDRLYRPRKNPGLLMTNPAIIPHRIKGDPESIASLIGYHITVHIDCDHWWTLAEARILQVGFAITEDEIRNCQNLHPYTMDKLVHDLAYHNWMPCPADDPKTRLQKIATQLARHTVHIELEAFDGEQRAIGQHPKQACIGDRLCLPHWGYFFSIWPEGKTRRDGDCPQEIYEEGSMRTTVTRPPPGSMVH